MPTRKVDLTDELDRFVLSQVKRGRYENASEVVQHAAKLAGLRAAIDAGDASGIAEGDVFARVRDAVHHHSPR